MKPISRLCLLLLFGLATTGRVGAQEALRIAAIVNDEVISAIDVGARLDLTLLGMGQGASDDLVHRLAPQVMRLLIDEKLQMQEARARGITVSDSDVEAIVKDIETSNRMPPGSLPNMLAQNHVPIDSLHEQLRARLAWQRLIVRRVRSTYQISDEEIDEEIARLKANAGKLEYLVSDIFLAIDPNSDEQIIQSQARRLVEQIKGGANFAALARQFSQSSAASASGDLGWVGPGQLEAPLERALAALTPGAVSEPIRTQTGLHVLQLREKRTIAGPNFDKALVKLSQILLPLDDKSTAAAVESQIELAKQIGANTSNCTDFNEIAQSVAAGNGDMGNVILKDLPAEIRQAVANAPIGKATAPIRTARGVSVLMVCARADDGGGIDRDNVRSQLLMVRADSESRRYLRDLRAAANIDVRQ